MTRWKHNCATCGRNAETRPYGPGGSRVCFPCGTGTPEAEATARAAFAARLEAAPVSVVTDDGIAPMPANLTGPGAN